MKITPLTPQMSLNKAYLRDKPTIDEYAQFVSTLKELLAATDGTERQTEEHHKNFLRDFFGRNGYAGRFDVQTQSYKGLIEADLVIRKGPKPDDPTAVIVETKRPGSREQPTASDPNRKALHEALLYLLYETYGQDVARRGYVQNLIFTDFYTWVVIRTEYLQPVVKRLEKSFKDWESGERTSRRTDFMHEEIRRELEACYSDDNEEGLLAACFDLRDYREALATPNAPANREALVSLFVLLSPRYLLQLPPANDSNELNVEFYGELLHIMGLHEVERGGRCLIERLPESQRMSGSFFEQVHRLLDRTRARLLASDLAPFYGDTEEDQFFGVALELCTTWVNRVLFLKLLEAQLISWHDKPGLAFLNTETIPNFHALGDLFLDVLNKPVESRSPEARKAFPQLPYLNSSLFELSKLEERFFLPEILNENLPVSLWGRSVLAVSGGRVPQAPSGVLDYLFKFLGAYDFGADSEEEPLKKVNRPLINAPVLGLIFEKINGYREGSFYTPSYVTMFLCRETVRRALTLKLSREAGIEADNYENLVSRVRREPLERRRELARIAEKLTVCDPAVGSGHFLVSALNEIITSLSDLYLLFDDEAQELTETVVAAENDELIVSDRTNKLLAYRVRDHFGKLVPEPEMQRIQRTLFQVKRRLIESALFGVDINPNSVGICRLRLWIELLKHAYYNEDGSLETLPNLELNIRVGNSVISRFDLRAELTTALLGGNGDSGKGLNVEEYRSAVRDYRRATRAEDKRRLGEIIGASQEAIARQTTEKLPTSLYRAQGELQKHLTQTELFMSEAEKAAYDRKKEKLEEKVKAERSDFEKLKKQSAYRNAFEWRYMFPETLDDKGRYVGFDVLVGNPPYIRQEDLKAIKKFLEMDFDVYESTADLLTYFIERAYTLLRDGGQFGYIVSNKFARASYGAKLRDFILNQTQLKAFIDFKGYPIFNAAVVEAAIIMFEKSKVPNNYDIRHAVVESDFNPKEFLRIYLENRFIQYPVALLRDRTWTFEPPERLALKDKVAAQGVPLKDWDITINRGVLTGFNEAFIVDGATRQRLIDADPRSAEILKPVLRGRNIKKWLPEYEDLWLILTHNGLKNGELQRVDVVKDYPAVYQYLLKFEDELKTRTDQGNHWTNLRDCAYLHDFNKPKIIYPEITKYRPFIYDESGYFVNNKAYILTGESLKYLTALFNSALFEGMFKENFPELLGGTRELRKVFFEQIPIKRVSETERRPFEELVDRIMALKAAGQSIEAEEARLNELVFDLYGLTDEERLLLS